MNIWEALAFLAVGGALVFLGLLLGAGIVSNAHDAAEKKAKKNDGTDIL